ncbi:MAG: polysaccharide pyruvyl transferase family protein [Clostridia bacterium]|nr:polysaccharide pyruvyl transferase family protein [Clostridia bacterium]
MKILLHGAINGTNFGDCLFATLFYKRLTDAFGKENVWFYDKKPFGIGQHLRETLSYDKHLSSKEMQKVNALVYISGGYFGDGSKSIKQSMIRYYRYFTLGCRAVTHNKSIAVVGLEVGPLHHGFVKKAAKKILAHASFLTVRNEESKSYLEEMGITHSRCTVDTAVSLKDEDFLADVSDSMKQFVSFCEGKILFLHMLPSDKTNERFLKTVLEPVTKFVLEHPEYCVVYGTDGGKREMDDTWIKQKLESQGVKSYYALYRNCMDMCYLLNNASVVVTRKLHVGIVAATLGKSVISTPLHQYKTARFYKQIGQENRCVSYDKLDKDTVYSLLQTYASQPISISQDIRSLAQTNLDSLVEFLKEER